MTAEKTGYDYFRLLSIYFISMLVVLTHKIDSWGCSFAVPDLFSITKRNDRDCENLRWCV